ncbi:selenium-dependent molybdenum cofactor biosynthesis protein YqeB [Geosporobacter subterraneus]|nr:selenium-dependent molybdenum cofactor biosynthesis protein YqeB [Geosporobacter subterraneus]
MNMRVKELVIIKGAGDLATAVGHKLFRSGFSVIMTEVSQPTCVRRQVSFASAIYEKTWSVEGITAEAGESLEETMQILGKGRIPIIIDPQCSIQVSLQAPYLVDAILAKKNTGTKKEDAQVVIGLGPGFTAGEDVDIVVETNRGHNLGRIYFEGSAEADTGIPGDIDGYTQERVLRAPQEGFIRHMKNIGDRVSVSEVISFVGEQPVQAGIEGLIRGLIHEGIYVKSGMKIGDVDPRGNFEYVNSISDKARNIAGGVLEAIMIKKNGRK